MNLFRFFALGKTSKKRGVRSSPRPGRAHPGLEALEDRQLLSTIPVVTLSDSGPGSLREAILRANANPGPDTIAFHLPGTISLASPLPTLADPTGGTVIDGATAPSFVNTPPIILHGTGTGGFAGLTITSANNTVHGLRLENFAVGIAISGTAAVKNTVQGNYIGTDGTVATPNGSGVVISGAANNLIGGLAAGMGNVISGNVIGSGIRILGTAAAGNAVQGNRIGTSAAGTAAVPNGTGIDVRDGAQHNVVGGTAAAARNLISGNFADAVDVVGATTTTNFIQGNLIGTNAFGTAALANNNGVLINGAVNTTVGGTVGMAGNVISGNRGTGVVVMGLGRQTLIQGNTIGLGLSGNVRLPNGTGVLFDNAVFNTVGGTTSAARNVISANTGYGIEIRGQIAGNNKVQGNFIGTDANGAGLRGNEGGVVRIEGTDSNTIGGTEHGAGNVISANGGTEVYILGIDVIDNKVQGNFIGTDVTGMRALGYSHAGVVIEDASATLIGGAVPAARNVIAGMEFQGVSISGSFASGNRVQGNYIGLAADGSTRLHNEDGVLITGGRGNMVGGPNPGEGNVIAANWSAGVALWGGSQTIIQGNLIGTKADGVSPLGNEVGVLIQNSSGNTVGGVDPAGLDNRRFGNTIAFNSLYGVSVESGDRNAILSNSIHDNLSLGIRLAPGANRGQAAPFVTAANHNSKTLRATFHGTPNTAYTIQFFLSDSPGRSSSGEGKTLLASLTVLTDSNGDAHAGGHLGIALTGLDLPLGRWISATATDPTGDTSPFSNAFQVT